MTFPAGDYRRVDSLYTPIQAGVVPVVTWIDEKLAWVGTAFAIAAAGLFLTAKHVFDEFISEYASATDSGSAGLYVLWETDQTVRSTEAEPDVPAALGGLLPVVEVSWHPTADLGLLQVQLPNLIEPITFPPLPLHVGLPTVGQHCAAVGYDEVRFDGDVPTGLPASIELTRQLAVTSGYIEEIHRESRDAMLDWPCFLTNARYPRGMSGGPVVDDSGRVVGVVCSGTDLDEADGLPQTSYATLVAALLPMGVPRDHGQNSLCTVGELADEGVLSITGLDEVDVVERNGSWVMVYVDSHDDRGAGTGSQP